MGRELPKAVADLGSLSMLEAFLRVAEVIDLREIEDHSPEIGLRAAVEHFKSEVVLGLETKRFWGRGLCKEMEASM